MTVTLSPQSVAPPVDYSRKWYVMTAIGLSLFLETIDTSAVNLALPTLVRRFQSDFATVQWVVLAFVLTQATLMLVVGRLGDMLGKKRIFISGIIVTAVGSILCALSPSVGWLIAFRILQAIGVAMALALGMGIATEAFPPRERGKALGTIGAIVSLGIVIGPILGGFVLQHYSWRWIFLLSLPLALSALPVAQRNLLDFRPASDQSFDYAGALTFFLGLLFLLLASTWGQRDGYLQGHVLALGAASLVGFVAFAAIEQRVDQPVVAVELLRNKRFSLNMLMRLFSFITFVGVILILPFYLENVLGLTPQQSGWWLVLPSIGFGVAAPLSGTLSDRWGARPLIFGGLLCMLICTLGLSFFDQSTTLWQFARFVLPFGVGMGIFQAPNNSIIMGLAPRERLGMTSGMLSVMRTLGRSIGIALIGSVWATSVLRHSGTRGGRGISTESMAQASADAQILGMQIALWVAAAVLLLALLLSAFDWWIESRTASQI